MLILLAQTSTETMTIAPSPSSILQATPAVTMPPVGDLISSSDLLSVIGRIDLMVNVIGVFSTILLFLLGYLVWKNYEAKNKFDKEVQEVIKIRRNLEEFYSSMFELVKQFDSVLNTFEKSLSKSADNAKLLKQVADEVEKIAKEAKAPAPLVKSIADAQKAIGESFNQLNTYAGAATIIREAMQPNIDTLTKFYDEIALKMSQIPQNAINTKLEEANKNLRKLLDTSALRDKKFPKEE